MANIWVMNDDTGQLELKDTESVAVASIQDLVVQHTTPPEFIHFIGEPAANGKLKVGAIDHQAMLADAISAVNTARSEIVTMVTTRLDQLESNEGSLGQAITALQAHDVVLDNHTSALDAMDVQLAAHDTVLDGLVANKVDKVSGKGLSTNDYTTTEKNKLASLATVATSGSYNDLLNKPTIPGAVDISGKSDKSQFAALSVPTAHGQTAGQTNGATNNPTNAPTDAPTNYGLLAAILGADINTTNGKQNATAANVNTIATNVNALATKYNELATKFNALITWLGNTATTGLTGNVSALRVAGAT